MLKALIIAGSLALSGLGAGEAHATTTISFDVDDGGFVKSIAAGAFDYDFTFNIPTSGLLTASLTSSTNKITFGSVQLNGVSLHKDTGPNNYSLPTALTGLTGTQTFHVSGTASAKSSFSTAIGFITAVPEPAAWMLMVVGFGALGASMRRRPAAGLFLRD